LGFDKTVLVMDLLYYNPNGFGVDLKQIDCDVFVEKTYLGKFLLDTLMHVNRMSEFLLPSRIELDMKSIMKNGLSLLMNKEVLVSVKGTARAGRAGIYKTVPFEYEEKRRLSLF
jgi:LEA14-like dessication related protein